MLISCKCLNITEYNNSVDEHNLKRAGSGLSLDEIAPGTEELHGHDGLAAFYYLYREYVKTAIGPTYDLTETVNQIDLAYEVPIKHLHIKYCINCNTIVHVKNTSSSEYWVNSKLLTTPERINALKENKLYSKVFGILMTADSTSNNKMDSTISTSPVSNMSTSTPTTPTTTTAPSMDLRNIQHSSRQQAYIKKLTQHLEEQLQRDYNETNERISRFIEQQAAILESNREKAKQEYQILVSKINRVPDELKVIYNHSSTSSINNNNEDFNTSAANTKSTTNALENQITNNDRSNHHQQNNHHTNKVAGNITTKSTQSLFTALKQEEQQSELTTPGLDTPPATPDSTPMSVGNSPTFRQQTSIFGNTTSISGKNSMMSTVMAGAGIVDGGVNGIDDCIFDLDGMENYPVSISNANQMSDVEETEDAEDALGELEGLHIPRTTSRPSGIMAKSLPISISNVIRNSRFNNIDDLETDELEVVRNVDIAASIQALARSVHGDTVFGDLPRPRISTQI